MPNITAFIEKIFFKKSLEAYNVKQVMTNRCKGMAKKFSKILVKGDKICLSLGLV